MKLNKRSEIVGLTRCSPELSGFNDAVGLLSEAHRQNLDGGRAHRVTYQCRKYKALIKGEEDDHLKHASNQPCFASILMSRVPHLNAHELGERRFSLELCE